MGSVTTIRVTAWYDVQESFALLSPVDAISTMGGGSRPAEVISQFSVQYILRHLWSEEVWDLWVSLLLTCQESLEDYM